jgi:hypothetical protein
VNLSKGGPSSNDYAVLILAYLIEDVIVLQTLTAARKRDIQATLLQHSNQLIEFIEYFLNSVDTIASAIHAFTMLATFLPVEMFFSTQIVDRLVQFLQSSTHRMKAAEFLSVIADRRGKYEDRFIGIVHASLSNSDVLQRTILNDTSAAEL